MESIIGHQAILTFFKKVRAADNMSHAYCFIGSPHLGKMHIARHIALECLGDMGKMTLATHPDVRLISQLGDPKTGKTKRNISIEQLREVRSFLSGHPFLGKEKIVIIDQAHLMTKAASNALLKSLEEPSAYSRLFLVTPKADMLPATILSRCQHIHFSRVPKQEIISGLQNMAVPVALAETIAKASHGHPGKAVQFALEPEALDMFENEMQRFTQLFGQPFYKKRAAVEDLFAKKDDHIAGRNQVAEVLSMWQIALHTAVREQEEWTGASLSIYNAIEQARFELTRNVHPRLLVDHVLLTIP